MSLQRRTFLNVANGAILCRMNGKRMAAPRQYKGPFQSGVGVSYSIELEMDDDGMYYDDEVRTYGPETIYTFGDLPEGTYAVMAYVLDSNSRFTGGCERITMYSGYGVHFPVWLMLSPCCQLAFVLNNVVTVKECLLCQRAFSYMLFCTGCRVEIARSPLFLSERRLEREIGGTLSTFELRIVRSRTSMDKLNSSKASNTRWWTQCILVLPFAIRVVGSEETQHASYFNRHSKT
jgi:hypothetical protein